jgi:hypothetical protein
MSRPDGGRSVADAAFVLLWLLILLAGGGWWGAWLGLGFAVRGLLDAALSDRPEQVQS